MQKFSPLALSRRTLVCLLLAAAFVGVAVPQVLPALRERSFGPILPYHSTNSYGLGLLHVPDTSERFLGIFAVLPAKQSVAVVYPESEGEGIFLSYLVSYFAWPREVRTVAVNRADATRELAALQQQPLAAIFFCGLPPPAKMRPQILLGDEVVMVPTNAQASEE